MNSSPGTAAEDPSKPTIGLVGFFGWGNYGDELFADVWRQELGPHFNLRVLPDLQAKPYFSRPLAEVLAGVDAILIGGGDLVNARQVSQLYWRRHWLELPTFIAGVGVPFHETPHPRVQEHLTMFFNHPNCLYINTRDIESKTWIDEQFSPAIGVNESPDLVCALDLPEVSRPERPIVGLVTRERRRIHERLPRTADERPEPTEYVVMQTVADEMTARGYEVRNIILGTGHTLAEDLADARWLSMPNTTLFTSENIDDLTRALGECSLLLTMKFHGAVVAAMYGVPSLRHTGAEMEPSLKRSNFFRRINRLDLVAPMTPESISTYFDNLPAPVDAETRASLRAGAKAEITRLRDLMLKTLA